MSDSETPASEVGQGTGVEAGGARRAARAGRQVTEARQQRAEAHIDGQAAVCPYAAVLPLRRPTRISYTSRFRQGAPPANLCGRRSRCLRTKIRQVSSILAALSLRLALAYTSRAAIRVADLTSSRGWMSSEASCGDADLKLEPDCGNGLCSTRKRRLVGKHVPAAA